MRFLQSLLPPLSRVFLTLTLLSLSRSILSFSDLVTDAVIYLISTISIKFLKLMYTFVYLYLHIFLSLSIHLCLRMLDYVQNSYDSIKLGFLLERWGRIDCMGFIFDYPLYRLSF